MIIISAMSSERVIGSGDGMPWKVPDEYAQFRGFITDQTVIMGRRSYEIFGVDLTSRHNIVITRAAEIEGEVEVAGSVAAAIELASQWDREVFCAGGGSIYAQMLPLADAMYLSFIKGDFSGDTHFPDFDEADWDVVTRRDHPEFEFVHYRRPKL